MCKGSNKLAHGTNDGMKVQHMECYPSWPKFWPY